MHGFSSLVTAVSAVFILVGSAPAAVVTIDGSRLQTAGASAAAASEPREELAEIVVGIGTLGSARRTPQSEATRNQISELISLTDRSDPIPAPIGGIAPPAVAPSFIEQLQQWLDPQR